MHGKSTGNERAAKFLAILYRHFEEIQGRLEASTEQCSAPLAMLPDIQVGCHLQHHSIQYKIPLQHGSEIPVIG